MPVQCAKCQSDNRNGRKFCGVCGAPLAVPCSACGFENEPDERFCGGCGSQVAEALARVPVRDMNQPTPSSEVAPRERRQVTILFADISSFTKMSQKLDPEETYAVLQSFFDTADAIIERYGGTIDKHIGDAVMALFGAPVAHGDDPLRAVRAGVELHQAIEALTAGRPHPFLVHIGIAAGEVVAGGIGSAGRTAYTVIGDSVNLAAWLQEQARPGETLISHAVYQSVAHAICSQQALVAPETGAGPQLKAWRVLALQEVRHDDSSPPIVGRERELRHLETLTNEVLQHGRGEAVLIRGDAGIGKSRLVEELCARAEAQGFRHHHAQVLDFGAGEGDDAIRVLVRSLLDLPTGKSPAHENDRFAEIVPRGLVRPELEIFLYDLINRPIPRHLVARYDAMDNATRLEGKNLIVTELIEELAGQAPLLLIVEDLHWAGSVTLDYLARLLKVIAEHPVVLVMTTRNEGDPTMNVWRGDLLDAPMFSINLTPLSRDASQAFAMQYFDKSNKFVSDCIARADGNPLFLQQLLRGADEQGRDNLPATIQSLILSRMDRLLPEDREALQTASVAGQRIDPDLFNHLLGTHNFDVTRLLDSQMIRRDGERFQFTHSLIRDGVYSSLLRSRAKDLHGRAAIFYENRDRLLAAEHLDKANDPRAPQAYLDAALQRQGVHHYGQARMLAERGLEIVGDSTTAYALNNAYGDILRSLGDIDRSVSAFEAALELAANDEQRCGPIIDMVRGMRDGHQMDEALGLLDQAQEIATRLDLTERLSQIHAQRGNLYFPRGKVEICREEQRRSLALAKEAASPELEAQALSGLGDAEYARGRMQTANGHFADCVDLCRRHGFMRIEMPNLALRGLTNFYCGMPRTCIDDCSEAIETALDAHMRRAELVARTASVPAHIESLDLDEAGEQSERAIEIIELLGARRFLPECLSFLAKIAFLDGRQDKAVTLAEEAVQISLENDAGRSFTGPWSLGTLAVVTGDPDAQRQALAKGAEILASGCVSHNYFWFYRDAIEASLRAGEWQAALRFADALESYMAEEQLAWSASYIAIARCISWEQCRDDSANRSHSREMLNEQLSEAGLSLAGRVLNAHMPRQPA